MKYSFILLLLIVSCRNPVLLDDHGFLFISILLLIGISVYGTRIWISYRKCVEDINANAQVMEETQKKLNMYNEQFHAVQNLTNRICSIDRMKELEYTIETIQTSFSFDFCHFWIINNNIKDELICIGSSGNLSEDKIPLEFLRKMMVETKTVMIDKNSEIEKTEILDELELYSLVACPLISENYRMGVLLVGNRSRIIESEQICLLESIGYAATGVVEKDEFEKIKENDSSLLESFSGLASQTVARIQICEEMQNKLEEKTRELKRNLNSLARAREMILQNVRMSNFSKNYAVLIKDIHKSFLFLFSQLSKLSEFHHKMFLTQQKSMIKYARTVYDDLVEEIDYAFENTVIELNNCIKLTSEKNSFFNIPVTEKKLQEENIAKLIMNALEMFSYKERQKVEIRIDFDETITWPVDQLHIEKVFFNLFLNAFEAMNYCGRLEIKGRMEKGYPRIIIKDNGPGIDENEIKKIALPFYTTKSNHTGLGLTISSEILQKYYGKLEIRSRKESSTEAIISFYKHSV